MYTSLMNLVEFIVNFGRIYCKHCDLENASVSSPALAFKTTEVDLVREWWSWLVLILFISVRPLVQPFPPVWISFSLSSQIANTLQVNCQKSVPDLSWRGPRDFLKSTSVQRLKKHKRSNPQCGVDWSVIWLRSHLYLENRGERENSVCESHLARKFILAALCLLFPPSISSLLK